VNTLRTTHLAVTLAVAVLFAQTATAQTNEQVWTGAAGTPLNWNGATWTPIGSPPDIGFNEFAVINNGGIAFLNSPATSSAGGLNLGFFDDPSGGEGTLEIRNGGSLTLVNNGVSNGRAQVGTNAGGGLAGTLSVAPGGAFTADTLALSGGASSVTVGGTSAGSANVTLERALIDNDLRLVGPNANFSTGFLQLFPNSTINAEITNSSHSAINVSGVAILSGGVNLDFNGFTPSVGNSWTLINAGGFGGNFTNPAVSSSASLGPGQAFVISKSDTQIDVSLERVLTLQVNRNTGAVSIDNDSTASLGFNAYSIRSDAGSLNPASWQSLSSGPFPNFQEANPSAIQLGEINPTGSATFNATSSRSLGNAFSQAQAPFGTPLAVDIEFSYQRDTDGKTIQGIVEYTGDLMANNLVLSIDPANGNAVVTNDSNTILNMDSYSLSSASGSLLSSWNSLTDQGETGWVEAVPTANRVSELNPTNSKTLNPGATFTLNGLWSTGGVQDVTDFDFQFRDTTLGTVTGIVEFSGGGAIDGDYDNSGQVGQGDLDLVLLNWGQTAPPIPAGWINQQPNGLIGQTNLDGVLLNWGNGTPPLAAINAVPEPVNFVMLVLGMMGLACQRCRIR